MKKSTVLIIILGGYLAIAPYLENPILAGSPETQIIENKTEQTERQTKDDEKKEKKKFEEYPKYVKTNYDCIVKNIRETSTDYVSKARKVSPSLEDSINKYSIEKIVDIRIAAYIGRLDVALERINHKMPEKELEEKTRRIAEQYCESLKTTNVSAPIDFATDVIVQASQKKMKMDVLFYERLLASKLKAGKKATDYKKLVQSAFSEKEYAEVLSKRLSALDGIYDAFIKSRVGFRGWFASSSINKMRNFIKQYYREQAEEIYPPKSKKTNELIEQNRL